MLWTTPGMLVGSSDAGPTQAIRSSCDKIAALLQTSAPVQSLPMFVRSRTVTSGRPSEDAWCARISGQPCGLSYRASTSAWNLGRVRQTRSRATPPKKTGVVATHQHIGLVTVLHKQKTVKVCFSIDGGRQLLPRGLSS